MTGYSFDKGVNGIRSNKNVIESMAYISLCTACLCLGSLFVIPLPFTAAVLSFQTVFINLTALCLKKKEAVLSVVLYLFMGIIGLPVFSGGSSGVSKLVSPVGGYYFGFLACVFLISLLKGKTPDMKRYLFLTVFIGITVQHIFATVFMSIITSSGLWQSFLIISLPFIPGDILKAVASAVIAVPLNKALTKK